MFSTTSALSGFSPFQYVLCVFITGLFYLLIYRLLFHPLASFPGPRLAALTDFYAAYYEIWKDGALVRHLEELHRIYGPVVRVAPNELHFNSSEAYFTIYPPRVGFTKDPDYYACFGSDESAFGYTDVRKHRERRELLNPLFSKSAILKLEHIVRDTVNLFVERIREHGDNPVNLQDGFRGVSMDIITTYSYGHAFGGVTAPGFNHPIPASIEAAITAMHASRFFAPLRLLRKLPPSIVSIFSKNMAGLTNFSLFLSSHIDGILANYDSLQKAEHETIYHHLLPDTVDPKDWPSKRSLVNEGQVLLIAGTDTVANTLTTGFYHLMSNPELMTRLVEELAVAWPDVDAPFYYREAERLSYLTAVIKESLRLSIGVPAPLPRIVEEPAKIDGFSVPAGAIVAVSSRFILLDPTVFPHPNTFNPDRWLTPDSHLLDAHLVVFSKGPRICLGLNLAWCELYIAFSHLVRHFEMQLHERSPEDMVYRDYFIPVWRNRPMHATVQERQV